LSWPGGWNVNLPASQYTHVHCNNKIALKLLIKIHFGLLLFVLANFLIMEAFRIGFHVNIIFGAKIVFCLLGIILFFLTRRRKKWLSLYFSIYFLYPLLSLIGWTINGMLGGVLFSIFFLFLKPPDPVFKSHDYIFYKKFEGLISRCCGNYEIKENVLLLFQKNIDEIAFDSHHSFEQFDVKNGKGYLKIKMESHYRLNTKTVDSVIVVNIK
jgi:predicted membrane protein